MDTEAQLEKLINALCSRVTPLFLVYLSVGEHCRALRAGHRQEWRWFGVVLAGFSICAGPCFAIDSPFATRVVAYEPAPGQNVQSTFFNDPAAALGPPVGGGTLAADNFKQVTLGGFGGSITLGFDHRILNQSPTAGNPRGLDLIVFGNAFFVGGNANRRWAEAGVIYVSIDSNGNGLADDPWYIIRGSHLPAAPNQLLVSKTWDSDAGDATFPPAATTWVPPGRSGVWTTAAPMLPAVFNGPVVSNPFGLSAADEGIWGYADCTPTMVLGDIDGDGVRDDAMITAEEFYTRPDDPLAVGISPGSGGGDAFDIDWAVDAATGLPANLPGIDFVRIVCGVDRINGVFGEISTEIGGIAEARIASIPARRLADIAGGEMGGDGIVDGTDFVAFVNAFGAADLLADVAGGVPSGGDGVVDGTDFIAFINSFSEGN